jgi:PhzF family phenazine biosynthesis protein
MSLPIFQVDAFTDQPFAGNPAGVCLLPAGSPRAADEAWMQAVAREINLSETAFLVPVADGFGLRWFTPAVEVDLCGHATLAGTHILFEQGLLASQQTARFHTRSGLLSARRLGGWIELDFPSQPAAPAEAPEGLLEALAVEPRFVGRNRFDFLVEVESEELVRGLAPDLRRLAALQERGVMVTSRSRSSEYDFVSRFFAPGAGIDEDPVTGSAHCCLGPFWGARLGKGELTGYQASARGGVVRVRLAGERVLLYGGAVTVIRGELLA